jgi:hypothetical protein
VIIIRTPPKVGITAFTSATTLEILPGSDPHLALFPLSNLEFATGPQKQLDQTPTTHPNDSSRHFKNTVTTNPANNKKPLLQVPNGS